MIRRPNTSEFKQRQVRVKRSVRTLLSPEQMNAAMSRESARVDRKSGGTLTLVLFRVTPARRTKLSTVRLVRAILERVRVTDDLGWFDNEHLGLLLPETTATGAWRLAQHICDVVAKRGARPLCTMYTYGADAKPVVARSTHAAPRDFRAAS
jgi:hypothetical protein